MPNNQSRDKGGDMTLDSQGNKAKRFCSYCDREIYEGLPHICVSFGRWQPLPKKLNPMSDEELIEECRKIIRSWENGNGTSLIYNLKNLISLVREHDKQEWVSVEDRLPGPTVNVLTHDVGFPLDFDVDWITLEGKWAQHEKQTTHWRPLPPSPKRS